MRLAAKRRSSLPWWPCCWWLFVFGIMSFWVNYQKEATYTSAAQTLVEWIARTGQYRTAMGTEIQTMLDDAIAVGSSDAYLSIAVLDRTCTSSTGAGSGSTVPAHGPVDVPPSSGWGDEIAQGDITAGDCIQVDIWSYYTIGAASLGVGLVNVPDGHAVMRSLWVAP